MSTWCWVISPFYDFCSFWSMAVNTIDKLQFLSFIFAVLLSVTAHFLFSHSIRRAQMHHYTKFCQNRSFHCGDIVIFRFFMMAAVVILDCRIYKILLAHIGLWDKTYHITNFCWNRSFHCGDVAFFSNFKHGHCRHLRFLKSRNLLATGMERVEAHQYAKFCQNRSNGCEDIKIFRFFKMAVVAILNFQNREFLFARGFCRAQAHQCTKFCQNRSLRCGDIVIFRIFKMAAVAILDFWHREILLVIVVQRVETNQHAKFCQNRSIGCEDIKILRFFKMAAVRHLGLFWGIFGLDHLRWVLMGLYHCAKFGYDLCSSFYNMNISIFGPFGWKMPIHATKIGVLGQFDTQNEVQYQRKPTKAHPCVSSRHLSH